MLDSVSKPSIDKQAFGKPVSTGDFDSVLILNSFPDEIRDDINSCDFFFVCLNITQ